MDGWGDSGHHHCSHHHTSHSSDDTLFWNSGFDYGHNKGSGRKLSSDEKFVIGAITVAAVVWLYSAYRKSHQQRQAEQKETEQSSVVVR